MNGKRCRFPVLAHVLVGEPDPTSPGHAPVKWRACMPLSVRAMTISEVSLIIDYFHSATPEHLEMLGVDPTRVPGRSAWHERFQRELELPVIERSILPVIWLMNDQPIGFSTSDKIVFGERANMHLHIVEPE